VPHLNLRGHWGQISTLNISKQCLDPVEPLLQVLIRLGFSGHLPAGLRYCRVTDPETLSDGLELCGIEFMATMGAHYDLARFGSERLSFSPRQADLLMVMGTIAKKMGPVLRQVYEQMAEPRWVLSVGACASSGGIFDTYSVLQGIDRIIPVDVYVPGCPPRPEALLYAIMQLQRKIDSEKGSFKRALNID